MDYDYTKIHAPGASNFSPSPHRLPTISAAQALSDLNSSATRCLSTGLPLLDAGLQSREPVEGVNGGVCRGGVTEIYGPSGVGKTALGMQIATGVLHSGQGVVWVDCAQPLSGTRFSQILTSCHSPNGLANPSETPNLSELLTNFTHFSTPTLAHLLALLSTTSSTYPPPDTRLIVIDSLPTLISNAFPRTADSSTPRKPGAPNPSARKFPIIQGLVSSLQKLAATRNLAVVVTSQCVTKMRPGLGAVLIPSIQMTAWGQGLTSRVAIFRDWGWDGGPEKTRVDDVRLARVIKAEGVVVPDARIKLVAFTIKESGLDSTSLPDTPLNFGAREFITRALEHTTTPSIPHKRKNPPVDLDAEIRDSDEDDEDYGWAEEDEEELPPLPPQWQGSEDVLLAPGGEDEEQAEEERDDELDFAGLAQEDGERNGDAGNDRAKELVIDDSEDELAL